MLGRKPTASWSKLTSHTTCKIDRVTATRRWFVGLVILFFTTTAFAADAPRLPCGGQESFPGYADLKSTPNVRVWSRRELGVHWVPPACTGWLPKEGIVVALAGQFQFSGSAIDLLARFGAISTLAGLRYWSVSENGWRVLISHATALEGPDLDRPRPDFSTAEMKSGGNLYFAHDDNRSTGEVVNRLKVREITANRLVVTTENVSPMRKLMLTIVNPEGFQSVHILDRRAPEIWGYYGLARTEQDLTSLLGVPEESYVNRAVALYRHLIGMPHEQAGPLVH